MKLKKRTNKEHLSKLWLADLRVGGRDEYSNADIEDIRSRFVGTDGLKHEAIRWAARVLDRVSGMTPSEALQWGVKIEKAINPPVAVQPIQKRLSRAGDGQRVAMADDLLRVVEWSFPQLGYFRDDVSLEMQFNLHDTVPDVLLHIGIGSSAAVAELCGLAIESAWTPLRCPWCRCTPARDATMPEYGERLEQAELYKVTAYHVLGKHVLRLDDQLFVAILKHGGPHLVTVGDTAARFFD
jgi:hypothetical protein